MKIELCAELKKLGDKIATELVFAEAGKDLGLLPVNSLLGQLEELAGREEALGPLVSGIQQARQWVDAIFLSTGTFSSLALKRFGEWVEWWQTSVSACESKSPPPPIPTVWQGAVAEQVESAPPAEAEPALVLNLEQDADLLTEFMNDSQEHLQNIEQGVLVLEQDPTDADTLNSIFRAFHTFKGCAGILNLTVIQMLAHELESLLDLARQHKLAITPAIINLILEGGDRLRQFANEIAAQLAGKKPPAPIVVPTHHLLECIRAALTGESASATPAEQPPQNAIEMAQADAPKTLPDATVVAPSPAAITAATALDAAPAVRTNSGGASVKVDTVKLDSLVDLVGEMLIAQSLVVQNGELNALQNEQLTRDLAHLGRISKDLQHTVMSLRMVPIRSTFQKMNRLVRDLSLKVGKQVTLCTEGEDTELDRTIVEEISDPLVHMIRNSIDHGIETARGSSAAGQAGARNRFS